jgi:DNA-binding winged helix-turn-helix (wHTH) protein/TolB-like protein
MASNPPAKQIFEFGPYRLDAAEHQLLRTGRSVQLPPKAFELLRLLVQRSGHLLEKQELMETLWPDSFVEEANLTQHVWTLRKILGDGENGLRYIETVPKRGYRFTAPVREVSPITEELVLERHTLTHIVTKEEKTQEVIAEDLPMLVPTEPSQLDTGKRTFNFARRIAVGLVVGILLLGAGPIIYRSWTSRRANSAKAAAKAPPVTSIAILPFKMIDSESSNEYLGLGITDSLIARLGNIHQLKVRPISAVRAYSGGKKDPLAIGREQGVDAILDGSLQRAGDRLRLNARLIRVSDGAMLWSGHFDDRFADVLVMQDSISDQVSCDVVTRLCGREGEQIAQQDKITINAYDLYLKGRYSWNKRVYEDYKQAIEYFNRAIALEPTYAQAYAGLAETYPLLASDDSLIARTEDFAQAKAAAQKAIELDPTLAGPHCSLGLIAMNFDWDWAGAEREYRKAIELNPNYATAHHWYAEFLITQGRVDESLVEIKRAHELDPLSSIINTDTGKILYYSRRYDEAIDQLHKTMVIDPDFMPAHQWLGQVYTQKGRYDEAIAEFEVDLTWKQNPWYLSLIGGALGVGGRQDEALKFSEHVQQLAKHHDLEPQTSVPLYIGLGKKDEVFALLDKEYEVRSTGLTSLKVNPLYDSLRSDPRFADLIRRVGLG